MARSYKAYTFQLGAYGTNLPASLKGAKIAIGTAEYSALMAQLRKAVSMANKSGALVWNPEYSQATPFKPAAFKPSDLNLPSDISELPDRYTRGNVTRTGRSVGTVKGSRGHIANDARFLYHEQELARLRIENRNRQARHLQNAISNTSDDDKKALKAATIAAQKASDEYVATMRRKNATDTEKQAAYRKREITKQSLKDLQSSVGRGVDRITGGATTQYKGNGRYVTTGLSGKRSAQRYSSEVLGDYREQQRNKRIQAETVRRQQIAKRRKQIIANRRAREIIAARNAIERREAREKALAKREALQNLSAMRRSGSAFIRKHSAISKSKRIAENVRRYAKKRNAKRKKKAAQFRRTAIRQYGITRGLKMSHEYNQKMRKKNRLKIRRARAKARRKIAMSFARTPIGKSLVARGMQKRRQYEVYRRNYNMSRRQAKKAASNYVRRQRRAMARRNISYKLRGGKNAGIGRVLVGSTVASMAKIAASPMAMTSAALKRVSSGKKKASKYQKASQNRKNTGGYAPKKRNSTWTKKHKR